MSGGGYVAGSFPSDTTSNTQLEEMIRMRNMMQQQNAFGGGFGSGGMGMDNYGDSGLMAQQQLQLMQQRALLQQQQVSESCPLTLPFSCSRPNDAENSHSSHRFVKFILDDAGT